MTARLAELVAHIRAALPQIRQQPRKPKKAGKAELLHAWAEVVYGVAHIVADAVHSPYSVHSYALGAGGITLGMRRIVSKHGGGVPPPAPPAPPAP